MIHNNTMRIVNIIYFNVVDMYRYKIYYHTVQWASHCLKPKNNVMGNSHDDVWCYVGIKDYLFYIFM